MKPFAPESGKELLEAFNAIVPFDVGPKRFACKATSERLIGYVIVETETQKDVAKAAIRESARFVLLEVEEAGPEAQKIIAKEWKRSQNVRFPRSRAETEGHDQ